jgi:3-phosphoglycerate kinase
VTVMKHLEDLNYKGKTVFLRVDFNVPLDETGNIRNDTRIKASLPTINYLVDQGAKLVIASHLGRPKGKVDPKLSLKPAAKRLSELVSADVFMAPDCVGPDVERLKKELKPKQVLVLENVRFHAEETANNAGFAQKLAQGIDGYVNDAFGSCHRAHASVEAVAKYVKEKAAGYLLEKEVKYLSQAIHSPKKPYVAILGGAKVSDKIDIIESLLSKADDILIGGAMAYTFFKAQGFEVGKSLVEDDKLEIAREILAKAKEKKVKFYLPVDHLLATGIDKDAQTKLTDAFPFPADWMAVDIGPKTVTEYSKTIAQSKTIFWNGPLGVFEIDKFAQGTMKIAEAVAAAKAVSIVGGGDSIAAVQKAGVSDKISHISTGGGASLEYLANETLPGIEALE